MIDRFPSSRHRIASSVGLLLVSALSASQPAAAQDASSVNQRVQEIMQRNQQAVDQQIEALKQGVVRIVAQKEVKEVGTGIVFSSTPQSVLIMTALHVVDEANSISVVFYSDQMKPYPAHKLPRHSSALDLAVVQVDFSPAYKAPANFPAFNFAANNTLKATQHLYSADGNWKIVGNNITSLFHNGDPQKFEYSNVSVGKGFSGGPIFDDFRDIIGMHLARDEDASYAIADKIDSALQVLEALGYTVPKAGPIVLPSFATPPATPTGHISAGSSTGDGPKKDSSSTPCQNGCEIRLGDLRTAQHFTREGRAGQMHEDIFSLPKEWPGSDLFLHVVYYPSPAQGGMMVTLYFAHTAQPNDRDPSLGFASLTGSSGQGMMTDSGGHHWRLDVRNPNFSNPSM